MNKQKIIALALGVTVVLLATVVAINQPKGKSKQPPRQYSCLTIINGGVYDLTSWIAQHPGGEEKILSICGKDGSTLFNDQHGGQRKPENILEKFKIGSLK